MSAVLPSSPPSQEDFWYSLQLEAEPIPRAIMGLEGLGQLTKISDIIEKPL
jgi:hypothetical protein